ncbi:MAG: 50S ribosomal protein L18 [Chlamydiae bacterium]|nr:50S ribosomal protein L18 [Chlamydiota bacterium]
MDSSKLHTSRTRKKRALRVSSKIRDTTHKPRLLVRRTNQHIHVQLVDDQASTTLASVSTLSKGSTKRMSKSIDSGKQLGHDIAGLAKGLGIQQVVFDRGRFKYHGIIASVAQGARDAGLVF